jgi:hypothetical protein
MVDSDDEDYVCAPRPVCFASYLHMLRAALMPVMATESWTVPPQVYVGTPLDAPPPGPHRAAAVTKSLPPWKQTPTDERGRPRFHGSHRPSRDWTHMPVWRGRYRNRRGRCPLTLARFTDALRSTEWWLRCTFTGAFTGGFSAGYFNTVGSKVRHPPLSSCAAHLRRCGLSRLWGPFAEPYGSHRFGRARVGRVRSRRTRAVLVAHFPAEVSGGRSRSRSASLATELSCCRPGCHAAAAIQRCKSRES